MRPPTTRRRGLARLLRSALTGGNYGFHFLFTYNDAVEARTAEPKKVEQLEKDREEFEGAAANPMAQTRRQLIDKVLDKLGVLVPGQAPGDEAVSRVDGYVDPCFATLAALGIVYVADAGVARSAERRRD